MKVICKILMVLAVAALLLSGPPALAADNKAVKQTKCPVMGYPINENEYVDYRGKRVYFCCAECKDKFKQEPEKYLKKLDEEK